MGGIHGLTLGHIAGIRIRADWSLLLILGLLTGGLGVGVFPGALPGEAPWLDWLLAALAAVLFLGSLLAHELGHALVARRQGIAVDGITLWLLGGVSELRGNPGTPGAEARTTGAGLGVSAGLAAVFWGLTGILTMTAAPNAAVAVPAWLALMNTLLFVFNAVPALPLDGGRLLHAGLWRWRGSRDRATLSAARLGRAFGVILIVAGVAGIVLVGALGGIWLALIGWFLMGVATAEARQVQIGSALEGLHVRDVMASSPAPVPAWITVDLFVRSFSTARIDTAVPIADLGGRVVGLVSVRRAAAVPPWRRDAVRLQEIAVGVESVPTASPDEPLSDLVERMRGTAGQALVLDGDRPVGTVTLADILRAARLMGPTAWRRPAPGAPGPVGQPRA